MKSVVSFFLLLPIFIAFTFAPFALSNRIATIKVLSPANNAVITADSSTATIEFQYDILAAQSISNTNTCIELVDTAFTRTIVKLTCVASSNRKISLSDIAAGDYLLYAYLTATVTSTGNPIDSRDTLTITRVIVSSGNNNINTNSATPSVIQINSQSYDSTSKQLQLTTDGSSDTIEVVAPALVQDIGFDQRYLDLCIKIINSRNIEVLKYTCIPVAQAPDITFTLPMDQSFTSFWVIRNNEQTQNPILMGTLETIGITVSPLQDVLPKIFLPRPTAEFGIPLTDTKSGEIKFEFYLRGGLPSAMELVQICMDMGKVDPNTGQVAEILATSYCFAKGTTYALLNQLERGTYQSKLYLRTISTRSPKVFPQSAVDLAVIVKDFSEFVPSYQWQVVHEWQTIPNGLETRLPMSGSAYKEARIPSPWRLQLAMPSPCKYFLRMDVKRDTTIEDILIAAGNKCKLEAKCFDLMADESLLPREVTVEECGLFTRSYSLQVDPMCQQQHELPTV